MPPSWLDATLKKASVIFTHFDNRKQQSFWAQNKFQVSSLLLSFKFIKKKLRKYKIWCTTARS